MTRRRTDYRDAIGWLYATARGDWDARNALAQMIDPVGMVDALVAMHLGLVNISTNGQPLLYLDHLRDHLDEWLDAYGMDE